MLYNKYAVSNVEEVFCFETRILGRAAEASPIAKLAEAFTSKLRHY